MTVSRTLRSRLTTALLLLLGLGLLGHAASRAIEASRAAQAPLPLETIAARYVPTPIAEVRPGDYVLSRDDVTGAAGSKPVSQVFRRTSDHLRLLEIASADGEMQRIETTNEHPFWVAGRGWIDAGDLSPGDELTDAAGHPALLLATAYEPHPEGVPVFNFEVEDWHSYHVKSHGARGPPLWVHNTCNDLVQLDLNYHAPTRFGVDRATHAADEAKKVLVNGRYIKNPTARNLSSLLTDSGRIGSKQKSGRFMYVIDESGNVIIGSRAGQHMPHPTLIGGSNPIVRGAGIVDIRGGRIYSIDNVSGHFKPGAGSLDAARVAFGSLPSSAFHRDFQGYLQFTQ